jgi:transposase
LAERREEHPPARRLHGRRIDDWITAVDADDKPDLHSFARGLRHDYDAVRKCLILPWNSAVEGIVNKIKRFKRQMYGRATAGAFLDILHLAAVGWVRR